MSNCIELHNYEVVFSQDEFDVETYLKVLEEHKEHKRTPELDDSFCWFLRDNSSVKTNTDGIKSIIIRFGKGQSSHTWRDFKWTIWYLNQFIKKPKTHTFTASDEFDGFNQLFPIKISWPYKNREEVYEQV